MKKVEETLFEWKKHWCLTLFGTLLFSLPGILIFLPVGNTSEYEIYKWYIYMFIVSMCITLNFIYTRCEALEDTIKKLNEEIEELKNK